jgi:hypothetical protein
MHHKYFLKIEVPMAKFALNTWGQSYLQSDNSTYQCMLVVHLHRFFEEKIFFKFESHSDHPKKSITMQFQTIIGILVQKYQSKVQSVQIQKQSHVKT